MNLFEKIEARLGENFILVSELARAIALAVLSGKNLLLWGPAGHGKSEMVMAALEVVTSLENVFTMSFGEGMDEATLWGGLDFAALEAEKVLRYFPEQSFLASEYAVFEELFDAPASVLLALKDTLTSRKLRKGAQTFVMRTQCVIALTNKDPQEISDLGPAAHALIERFPLQLKVDWPSYTAADYLALFDKVGGEGAANGMKPILAELLAKAGENDTPISPRSAVHALQVVQAAAKMRGSSHIEKEDLLNLRYVDGLESIADEIQKELDAAMARAAAQEKVSALEAKLNALVQELNAAKAPIRLLQVAKKFMALQDELATVQVTDGLTEKRNKMREAVGVHIQQAQKKALDVTHV